MNRFSSIMITNDSPDAAEYFISNQYLDLSFDYVRLYQNADCTYMANK